MTLAPSPQQPLSGSKTSSQSSLEEIENSKVNSMRAEQHFRTFIYTLNKFDGTTPLTKFLPEFFRQHKQMGSNDRRIIVRLLYNYFRLGNALKELLPEERVCIAEFLCNIADSPFLRHFRPDLNERLSLSIDEKITLLEQSEGFDLNDVFPFTTHLSSGIDKKAFLKSFFAQPDLYIRIHSGKEDQVKAKIMEANIPFWGITTNTVVMPNGTKLDQLLGETKDYEIQDLSSQQTAAYLKPNKYDYWWDACAASGGKSLLLFGEQPQIKLLVSDIRESVLNNLDDRFENVGLKNYHKKVIDLTQNVEQVLHHYVFDGIILDVPCTGSGTWGRTPEMISQFHESKIKAFQTLQKTIASRVLNYLKPGKPLVYITCSVFKEENEEMVDYLVREYGLKLESSQVLKGYEHKADTMFVARLIKVKTM